MTASTAQNFEHAPFSFSGTHRVQMPRAKSILFAVALLAIGLVPARATILSGNLAVYNAAGTTLLGYVSDIYDGQDSFTYSSLVANALTVTIDSSASAPFSMLETNPPGSNHYFAAVGGSGGSYLSPTSDGYTYLSGGALTAAGSTPSASAQDLQALGYNGPEESTIWSHTGQIISSAWVNTDGTTSPNVFFYDPVVDYIGITGSLANYNAAFGDNATQITLEFTTPFPSTSAPEPASIGLIGIGIAAMGLTWMVKRRAGIQATSAPSRQSN